MENIYFKDKNGNKLLGTLSVPNGAKSIVILVHGFSSSRNSKTFVDLQDELNVLGIGTFRIDMFGHGELYCKNIDYKIAKETTLTDCVNSVLSAIDVIKQKGDYSIGLIGSSFGGLATLIAVSQSKEIKALALKSPVSDPIGLWKILLSDEEIEQWKATGKLFYDDRGKQFELNAGFWNDFFNYDTYELARGISCSTMVVHGSADTVVPIKQSYDLANVLSIDVTEIENAEHNYGQPEQYEQMKKHLVGFLHKTLIF